MAADNPEILSGEDIAAMNRVEDILKRVADEAGRRQWDAPNDIQSSEPRPYGYGRLAERADEAAWSLFQVKNVASTYAGVTMTEEQLHNRGEAAETVEMLHEVDGHRVELDDTVVGEAPRGADEHDPRL